MDGKDRKPDETKRADETALPLRQPPLSPAPELPLEMPPQPPVRQNDIAAKPSNDQTEGNQQNALGEFERSSLFWARINAIFVGATLAAIVGTAVVFWGQWNEMAHQTDLLNIAARQARRDSAESGIATQKQLNLAQQQVKLATDESAQNAKRVERQLKILQDQAKATHDQADAAIKSAIAIQEQTVISECPWLSVEVGLKGRVNFVNGSQPVAPLKLSIRNVGHSTAKDIQIDVKMFPNRPDYVIAPDARQNQKLLCTPAKRQTYGLFDLFPVDAPFEREVDVSATSSSVAADSIVRNCLARRSG